MKKYRNLLLTIVCLASTLTLVSAAETEAPAPSPAPAVAPSPAPIVENAKTETLVQKAENALEKTEEKIKDAAEKVKEKAEEVIEGKKAEPVKAEEEAKPEEPAEMEEAANENEEEKMDEKDSGDAESEPSEEEEISITEGAMEIPEIMPEDALLRACILHWLCHLNEHAHCWGPNCFFGHSNASSPIRRENSIEEMLPNYCIGVLTSPIPEALGTHFGLRPYEGLWVEHVLPGSPAAEAGIQRGDLLLRATIQDEENGEKIKKVFWLNHPVLLMDLVEQTGPEEIELTTICGGKEQKINLKPAERKELMEKAGLCK